MPEEKTPTKPAAKADEKKKAKPPAIEKKPFQEFISEHFLPTLKTSLAEEGVNDVDLTFGKMPLPIKGLEQGDYWQVQGNWQQGQRQFLVAFQQDSITSPKFYAAADRGSAPTTLESFMIDEKKVTLALMVMYVVRRLNAQKWLTGN